MVDLNEVENALKDELGDAYDWAVDAATKRTTTFGENLDNCNANNIPSWYNHRYQAVSVELTWLTGLLSKAAAAYLVIRIGLKKVATRAITEGFALVTIATALLDLAKSNTYTFGGVEWDVCYNGDCYPVYNAVAENDWKAPYWDGTIISSAPTHPAY